MLRQSETVFSEVLEHSELAPLLARIAASRHFRRSLRLRTFLDYVCEETFAGRAGLINEQTVGHRVFGRAPDYDPTGDNIVRVEARELRKRLEAYFAEEGIGDPVIIRMPKGGYVVTFEPRPPVEPVFPQLTPVTPPPSGSGLQRKLIAGLAVAVLALAILSVYLYRRPLAPTPADMQARSPLVTAFWVKVFDPQRTTVMVLPDSNFALLQDLRAESISAADYTSGRYLAQLKAPAKSDEMERATAWIAARNFAGVGDVTAMTRLMLLNRSAASPLIRSARDLTVKDLKSQNIILFGSARSNPWVDFLQRDARFTIGYDLQQRHSFLRDRQPEPGKPGIYIGQKLGEAPYDAYALISGMRNLDGSGYALAVAGTNTQATEAAGEFLADWARFASFLKRIGWADQRQLPIFQLALKVRAMGGSSVSSLTVAHESAE